MYKGMTMNLSWQERHREREKETDSSASGNSYISHGRGQGHIPKIQVAHTEERACKESCIRCPKGPTAMVFVILRKFKKRRK